MTWVESEPPARPPAFIKASYSGNTLRLAKKPDLEDDLPGARGASISRAKASTTNDLKLVPRSNARIFAFLYRDSGMSIVVFNAPSMRQIWIYVNMDSRNPFSLKS